MYMDEYVISGIVIVVATIVATVGIGHYGWKHIKQDMENSKSSGE